MNNVCSCTLAALSLAAAVEAQVTTRVSVGPGGIQANSNSRECAISGDGRLVVFESFASNLVPGDTNGKTDVFLHDLSSATTTRVSTGPGGIQGDRDSVSPVISSDGRYIAFASFAQNLVAGDVNGFESDVFVRDLQTGALELVSINDAGVQANASSVSPSLSADGRYVAFSSNATNLIPGGDGNLALADVLVRDRLAGTTTLASRSTTGFQANGQSSAPSISGDGRLVAFVSAAPNLAPTVSIPTACVFVRDLAAGTTELASPATDGNGGNGQSLRPSISFDGRFVSFDSLASNLVAADTNGVRDVFVRDIATSTTSRVSVTSSGAQASPGESYGAAITPDGRYVAFHSAAANLSVEPTSATHVFLHDRQIGTTTRESLTYAGSVAGVSEAWDPALSGDARFVACELWGPGVPGDTANGDIYVRDRQPTMSSFCSGDGTGAPCPCDNGLPGHGCDNSTAGTTGAWLTGGGIASLAADTVAMSLAAPSLPGSLRIFLQGDATIAPTAFGDGLRCVGGSLKRLYVIASFASAVTVPAVGDPGFSSRSAALGDAIAPGSARHYQGYYRDPSVTFCPPPAGDTFNISNGLTLIWAP